MTTAQLREWLAERISAASQAKDGAGEARCREAFQAVLDLEIALATERDRSDELQALLKDYEERFAGVIGDTPSLKETS